MPVKQMIGSKFGRLIVCAEAGRGTTRQALWSCICECNNRVVVAGYHLRSGNTKSCGCLQRSQASSANTRHGLASSPEYRILNGIIQRCTNPTLKAFDRYGGRGIKVCDRWLHGEAGKSGIELFFDDMGSRPTLKHSIDRVDNNGDYEPGNCRWATRIRQARNKSNNRIVKIDGEEMSLAEACDRKGVSYKTVWERLNRGLDINQALHAFQ